VTIYRHRLSGVGPAGDVWNCVMHSTSDLIIGTVHPAFVAQVGGDLLTAMQALWHTTTACTEIVTDELDPVSLHAVAQERDEVDYPGTSTDQMLPQGVSIVVSWVTTRPGKHGRGRIFLPGPVVTATTATGLYSGATTAAVKNAAASFRSDFSGTATLVLLDKVHKATTTVVDARVSNKPSYQRRRLNKVTGTYA
jgi:hypothetical protein